MNLFTFSKLKNNPVSEWQFSDGVLPEAGVINMTIRSGGSVVSSAVEQGSFATYNKVTEPLEITATLSFQGTDSFLQSVLDNLKTLKESVTVFSIETPAYEYQSMTVEKYDYSWTREIGRGVLIVNATLIEIKEVQVAYTQTTITEADTKDVSATSTVDSGLQQAQEPSQQQEEAGKSSRQSILRSMGVGG